MRRSFLEALFFSSHKKTTAMTSVASHTAAIEAMMQPSPSRPLVLSPLSKKVRMTPTSEA
eukprot:scaffold20432_cov70-Phaeocystis_antarctica.AAC.5